MDEAVRSRGMLARVDVLFRAPARAMKRGESALSATGSRAASDVDVPARVIRKRGAAPKCRDWVRAAASPEAGGAVVSRTELMREWGLCEGVVKRHRHAIFERAN